MNARLMSGSEVEKARIQQDQIQLDLYRHQIERILDNEERQYIVFRLQQELSRQKREAKR